MTETYIFISYRREDTAGHAGRIYDRLAERFGEAQVFLDFNAIPGATDFTEEIREALGRANVLLAVIGPRWLSPARQAGPSRIKEPNDLVRAEIGTALRSRIMVVPVLVSGAVMPTADQLPQDLSNLPTINAIEVSDRRFSQDVENLIRAIERTQNIMIPPPIIAEIHPGHWEIRASNYGLATATILVELRADGTLSGRLAGIDAGAAGVFGAMAGAFLQAMGQLTYIGAWNYDASSKILTLQLVSQTPGFGGGLETSQIRITGSDRGVYQGVDQAMKPYTLKRIG